MNVLERKKLKSRNFRVSQFFLRFNKANLNETLTTFPTLFKINLYFHKKIGTALGITSYYRLIVYVLKLKSLY